MGEQKFWIEDNSFYTEITRKIAQLSPNTYLLITDLQNDITYVPKTTADTFGIEEGWYHDFYHEAVAYVHPHDRSEYIQEIELRLKGEKLSDLLFIRMGKNEHYDMMGFFMDIVEKDGRSYLVIVLKNENAMPLIDPLTCLFGQAKFEMDLKDYIKSLDPDIILEAMKNMTPAQQKKYINNINPQTYAENSNIRFEICKPEDKKNVSICKNKKNKNDGIYQLFLVKNNRTEHVHFKRKTAFIVFLIYLADRLLKGVETTYIDLESKNIEKEFITMYDVIYPNEKNAKEKYDNLTKIKSDGKNKKQRISDCYSYITEVIAESFEKLDENVVSPFVIGSQSEHIHTKQEMISIPVEILKIADDLASKSQTTSWLKKALKFIKN